MPWSLVINFVVGFLNRWLATKRAEQALRDLGAAQQANTSRAEAERQEIQAKTAGDAASDGEDDPRDLRKD